MQNEANLAQNGILEGPAVRRTKRVGAAMGAVKDESYLHRLRVHLDRGFPLKPQASPKYRPETRSI